MTTPIGKFKLKLNDMFTQLEAWIPRDSELEKQKMLIDAGMFADPRGTVIKFMDGVSPYADHIMKEDDDFFINNTENLVDSEDIQLCMKIKNLWLTLDDTKQSTLKKYFKLLLILGTIATRNQATLSIINMYRDPANPLSF
jgi:hypothetical protein